MHFPVERPDFNDAIIMRRGASVEHVVSNTSVLAGFDMCPCPSVITAFSLSV